MKALISGILAAIIITPFLNYMVSAKGCSAGHCVHVACSHSDAYKALNQLHDSSFSGFIVLKKDTLFGQLSGFNSYELKLTNGTFKKRITYSRINFLHLEESTGIVNLSQLPNRSGFFRVLFSDGSVALYDRGLMPHHSISDVDTGDMIFRFRNFNRYLVSDFSKDLRKVLSR